MTAITLESLAAWFAGRLPDDWFTAAPEVTADREEVLVVGTLAEPAYPEGADDAGAGGGPSRADRALPRGDARRAHADRRRRRAPHRPQGRMGRTVRRYASGVHQPLGAGDDPVAHAGAQVLDTLVGAGVARSRSDALGWCVRLVRDHQGEWIQQLQDALVAVRAARASGPTPSSD